jgi:hypothetical protein
MAVVAWRFEEAGYRVHSFSYSQRTESLDDLSAGLHEFIEEGVDTPVYHLIAHSLGNIIIRNGFKQTYREGLGRIVMIAPPNRPAELAQLFEDNPIYQWMTGDSGQKLADPSFYQELPIPTVEFGVIAGSITYGIGFDGPNDGVVKVENTKLEGMADWIVLEHTHTFIMTAQDTFERCLNFIETGAFEPSAARGN